MKRTIEEDENDPTAYPSATSVLSVDDKGNRYQTDLPSWHLSRRVIFFTRQVNSITIEHLIQELHFLEEQAIAAGKPQQPIHLYINSPGGSVIDAEAAYDAMQLLTCPVYTYATGYAASAGSLMFMAGEKGHRYITPHGKVMMHQLRGGGSGGTFVDQEGGFALSTQFEIELEAMYLKHIGDALAARRGRKLTARETTLLANQIEEDMRSGVDKWFTGQQAVDYGLADEILTKTREGVLASGVIAVPPIPDTVRANQLRRTKAASKVGTVDKRPTQIRPAKGNAGGPQTPSTENNGKELG